MSGDLDVTGVWYGRYEAFGHHEVNGFIAVLEDAGGAISGVITEPDTSGQAEVRRAYVDGQRSGAGVRFVKQYDGAMAAHAVRYSGRMSADGTEIRGTWLIVRSAGLFVMTREKFDAKALEEEREVELTVR